MKALLTTLFFLGLGLNCNAQKMELGFWAGLAYYSGDLTPAKKPFLKPRLGLGLAYQYHFSPLLGLRASYNWAQLSGDDQQSAKTSVQRGRNLHFRSDIHELSVVAYFSPMGLWAARQNKPVPTLYMLAGAGVFYFNPQGKFENDWVNLQPLGTEGQGIEEYSTQKKYSRLQLAIPLGAGVRLPISHFVNINLEMTYRKTFTDYIDDVSTVYAPTDLLREQNGELSAKLSNRTYNKEGEQVELEGQARGSINKNKDAYLFLAVRFNYCISRKKRYKTSPYTWM